MTTRRCFLSLSAIVLFFSNGATPLFAVDDELLSLRGLNGLYVLVESLDPVIEKDGLSREQIQKETEQRLRKAGIRVLSKEEWVKTKAGAYLYVNLNARKSSYGIYMNAISVELVQKVVLVRNPKIEVFAATWSKQLLGQGGYLAKIRYSIQDVVDLFLNAYAAANPK